MELAQSCKSFCHDLSETWLFELLQAGLKGQRERVPQIQKTVLDFEMMKSRS